MLHKIETSLTHKDALFPPVVFFFPPGMLHNKTDPVVEQGPFYYIGDS
jgi:hypothetical protein